MKFIILLSLICFVASDPIDDIFKAVEHVSGVYCKDTLSEKDRIAHHHCRTIFPHKLVIAYDECIMKLNHITKIVKPEFCYAKSKTSPVMSCYQKFIQAHESEFSMHDLNEFYEKYANCLMNMPDL